MRNLTIVIMLLAVAMLSGGLILDHVITPVLVNLAGGTM